jgi:release factor glutamine methyltransferase
MPEVGPIVRGIIAEAAERLRSRGIPESRREALRIWGDITGDRWAGTSAQIDIVNPAVLEHFERAVTRRATGEPAPYVTGTAGFRHLTLRCDRRALIPRPETEGLIDLLLPRVHSGRVADVGTGTGCLALSLAVEGGFNLVVAVERSSDAITLARENAATCRRNAPIHLVEGDVCGPLRGGAFDALVSNPPYLTLDEYAGLDQSVREWEPASALIGGAGGLEFTRRLLEQGREVVRSGGWVALEVDSSRAGGTARLATQCGWHNVSVYEDLFGRERYLLAQRSDTR